MGRCGSSMKSCSTSSPWRDDLRWRSLLGLGGDDFLLRARPFGLGRGHNPFDGSAPVQCDEWARTSQPRVGSHEPVGDHVIGVVAFQVVDDLSDVGPYSAFIELEFEVDLFQELPPILRRSGRSSISFLGIPARRGAWFLVRNGPWKTSSFTSSSPTAVSRPHARASV